MSNYYNNRRPTALVINKPQSSYYSGYQTTDNVSTPTTSRTLHSVINAGDGYSSDSSAEDTVQRSQKLLRVLNPDSGSPDGDSPVSAPQVTEQNNLSKSVSPASPTLTNSSLPSSPVPGWKSNDMVSRITTPRPTSDYSTSPAYYGSLPSATIPKISNDNNTNTNNNTLQQTTEMDSLQLDEKNDTSILEIPRYRSPASVITELSDDNHNTGPKTSTQMATEFAQNNTSKYAKVSYHLTNDPAMIKIYRDAAEKTNDTATQLLFAKYLLETASLFNSENTSNKSGSKVIGSMWGVSATKKSNKPEPFYVIPPEEIIHSSQKSSVDTNVQMIRNSIDHGKAFSITTVGQSSTVYQQQVGLQVTSPRMEKRKNEEESANKLKRSMLEEEGLKWIKRLVKQNVPEACYIQSQWMKEEQHGFKKNRGKMMALLQVAARAAIPEAMFQLGEMYEEDEEEPAKIVKYYRAAADACYVDAIYVSYCFIDY
jgi:hypothetical protein